MAEVRFHDHEDERREAAVKMLKRHVAKQLGHRQYDVDIEHFEYAVIAFADEWSAVGPGFTAEQCMFRAYDALRGAAERFSERGDHDLAAGAAELADGVAELDPRRQSAATLTSSEGPDAR